MKSFKNTLGGYEHFFGIQLGAKIVPRESRSDTKKARSLSQQNFEILQTKRGKGADILASLNYSRIFQEMEAISLEYDRILEHLRWKTASYNPALDKDYLEMLKISNYAKHTAPIQFTFEFHHNKYSTPTNGKHNQETRNKSTYSWVKTSILELM